MARLFLAVALATFADFPTAAEEIPLKEIWAHNMPGTRDIHELEAKPNDESSLMAIIGRALRARQGRTVGPAIAVQGTGPEALKRAYAVITKQEPAPASLPSGNEVSVVFYTHYSSRYVHLQCVRREGKAVRIEYELIPHLTKDVSLHFALIPLGELESGEYKVEIAARPISQKFLDDGFRELNDEAKSHIVSGRFKFRVD